jgi:hypothetical protein
MCKFTDNFAVIKIFDKIKKNPHTGAPTGNTAGTGFLQISLD